MDLIASAATRGTTVIVATHDLALVRALRQRAAAPRGRARRRGPRRGGAVAVTRGRLPARLLRARRARAACAASPVTTAVSVVDDRRGRDAARRARAACSATWRRCSTSSATICSVTAYPRRDGAFGRAGAALARARVGDRGRRARRVRVASRRRSSASARGVGRAARCSKALDENPLPASLELALAPEQRTPEARRARWSDALARACPASSELASRQDWVEGYAARARAGARRRLGLGAGARARDAADRRQHDPPRGLRAPRRARDPRAGRREPRLRARAVPARGPAAGRGRRACSRSALLYALFRARAAAASSSGSSCSSAGRAALPSAARDRRSLVAGGAALGFVGAAAARRGGGRA